MLSCSTDLCKLKELIRLNTSLIRGGSKKIKECTLLVRKCLKLYGALSLKLLEKFSPTFEKKTLNSLIICCLLLMLQPLRLIFDGKILEQYNFPGSSVRSSSHVFKGFLYYFPAPLHYFVFLE